MDLLKNCIVAGIELPIHGNFGQDRGAVKEHACGVFLTKLASVSEQQPDSEEIHLVERVSKIDLYEAMCTGMKENMKFTNFFRNGSHAGTE